MTSFASKADGFIYRMTRTRTFFRLLVLSALWLWTDGDTDVSCVVMETCILPCSFQSGPEVVIHWMRTPGEDLVHSYYNSQDQLGLQNLYFRGRTSLFRDQISRGNASLQLTGVQVQDQGGYKCKTSTPSGHKETIINLRVNAPVREVHIEQVGNRLSCRSKGIYPEPGLTWSTNPASNRTFRNTTTVQQNEQLLYNISSSLVVDDGGTDVDYNCTVRTRINRKGVSLGKLSFISGSSCEPSVLCTSLNISLTDFSLVWTFNHNQAILNWNNGSYTVSERWRRHVKNVSQSGSLTLKQLTPDQGGIYSCELSGDEETYISNTLLKIPNRCQTSVSVIIGVVVGVVLVAGLAAGLFMYNKYKKTEQNPGQTVELSTVQRRE